MAKVSVFDKNDIKLGEHTTDFYEKVLLVSDIGGQRTFIYDINTDAYVEVSLIASINISSLTDSHE